MTDNVWTKFQMPEEQVILDQLRMERDAARDAYNEEYQRQLNRCKQRARRAKAD